MTWKVKVKGIKELQKELDNVAKEMKQELKIGTEEAAENVADIVRSNAPGSLSEAVDTKSLPERSNYPQTTMVGLSYNKAPHQHLVEYGTGPRYTNDGAYRGQMPPNPFFRKSIDGARDMIKDTIQNNAREPIDRR